ncbi:G-type lectin S-receptor-like serine/threonine-protein kinase At4g27290 isoform X2 [Wolffia australiana]
MFGGRIQSKNLFFFAAVLPTLFVVSGAGDSLVFGRPLPDGEFLVSSDGVFKLGFFSPGKSSFRYVGIWYNRITVQTVIWVANRETPLKDSTGVLSISASGGLFISDSRGKVYWAALPAMPARPAAKLLPTGNFAVSGAAGEYAWQSFDHPTDTILPYMKVGVDWTTRKTKNLTSWKSADDPAPGDYTFYPNIHGDPQTFLLKGENQVWRSGPWVGEKFSGIPQMTTYDFFKLRFVSNAKEAYYEFTMKNTSILSRLVLQANGVMERLVWKEEGHWTLYWYAPRDDCDHYGYCGPFAVCDASQSLLCDCLRGFEPSSPENWKLRDWKDGCRRSTAVECESGAYGFVKVTNAKLPDTSRVAMEKTMGMEECREACLRNCSCAAYAAAQVVNGTEHGCLMWSGELVDIRIYYDDGGDLFVRLALADVGDSPGAPRRIWPIPAAAALLLLLLALLSRFLWRRRKSNRVAMRSSHSTKSQQRKVEMNTSPELDLPMYELPAIIAATDDFSAANKLGEGGFGPVYRGLLEGKEVAVKRLAKSSSQGLNEFMNEVSVIAKLQHRNLVGLLGCCVDGEERILIYEYMPHGSLDSFIFEKDKALQLDWSTRFRIITGVARGLLYLHQDSRLRIIHRDLKASNVLLADGMNPKISDFGLARVVASDEAEGNTRRVVGT